MLLPAEPTAEERAEKRKRDKEVLEGLDEDTQRALFGLADASDAPLPSFYNRNANQCPDGGACHVAHRIWKADASKPGGGTWRRGRTHFPNCPQQRALDVNKKLKH